MSFVSLLVNAIDTARWILNTLILIRIILSWIRIGATNPVTRFIYNITEIFLSPVRNLLAKSPIGGPGMMLDFSPLICVLLVDVISRVLIQIIVSF